MTGTTSPPADPTATSRYWHPRKIDPTARQAAIRRLLALARDSLSMDVGYFGTFDDGVETYHVVDGAAPDGSRLGPREGSSLQLDQTLCWQVVQGNMGNLVTDATREVATRELLPVTEAGVRSYLGVPVHAEGEMLGMLCLISSTPRPQLGASEIAMMRLFAQIVALELSAGEDEGNVTAEEIDQLHQALVPDAPELVVVFQPVAGIAELLGDRGLRVRSVEALSRFPAAPDRPVERWFDVAWRQGLGVDLEMAAIERAFAALALLPENIRLAVNASPETLASSRLQAAIPADEAYRITVELTEHVLIDDYEALRPGLEKVRATGVSLAIDDLGTGSSNLQHVLELAPEVIKVDLSITQGVESDPRRRAMIAALVSFTRDTGIALVTEGVEEIATARELDRLGVQFGQGYWLCRAIGQDRLPQLRHNGHKA